MQQIRKGRKIDNNLEPIHLCPNIRLDCKKMDVLYVFIHLYDNSYRSSNPKRHGINELALCVLISLLQRSASSCSILRLFVI